MILLSAAGAPEPRGLQGVRRVFFKDADDIRRKLVHSTAPTSALRASASTFVPTALTQDKDKRADTPTQATVSTATAQEDEPEDDLVPDVETDQEVEKPVDVESLMESLNTSSGSLSEEALAARERAAKIFQKAFRSMLRRKSQFVRPGIPTSRAKQIAAFLEAAKAIQWPPKSYYRFVYSGPLPHLLVCLEWLLSAAMARKTKVKKRATDKTTKHEDLDELFEQQTKLSGTVKQINALREALKAESDVHLRLDLEKLKTYVQQVAELLKQFSPLPGELSFDIEIVYKGIVEERVQVKAEKPVLNVEDIGDDL
ncbi:hypothetical protein BV25DRAFT_824823 [Artomyces pyxidatus]|uniref:Uncharacterized protein n=1 Tax=Artomyces pyxidatus TaxID=48021 RepID=A0ACB8SXX9_9AGAM|nr:hypothetical protein BV25DRAFT_824823 [Artomyces pyxidatus]